MASSCFIQTPKIRTRELTVRPAVYVRFGSKADMCSAKRHVSLVPIADIGPSTHLAFWPSLIQELPTGSAGAFLEALMPSADKINSQKISSACCGAPRDRP